MEFGKLYTRIPRKVYALKWTPHSLLPGVEEISIEVPEQPPKVENFDPREILAGSQMHNYYTQPQKLIRVVIKGQVLINGALLNVMPTDFVLYCEKTKEPIGVLNEKDFLELYTDKFELCGMCSSKAEFIKNGGRLPTIDDFVKLLQEGKEIKLENGVILKSIADLRDFAAKHGINLLTPK
jgi:hypothetical protein